MAESSVGNYPAIIGTGHYVPVTKIPNRELKEKYGINTTEDATYARTGIWNRYVAGPDEPPSFMGRLAVEGALRRAGLEPGDIGALFLPCMEGDLELPDTAIRIQNELGMSNGSTAMDIRGACVGFLNGLRLASQWTQVTGEPTVVVGVSTFFHKTNHKDRRLAPLLGDGSGAVVIANQPNTYQQVFSRVTNYDTEAIFIPSERDVKRRPDLNLVAGKLFMDGHKVSGYANASIPKAISNAAKIAHIDKDGEIDWSQVSAFVPHPGNGRMVARLMDGLLVPASIRVVNVEEFGNTSFASIPLALSQWAIENALFKPDEGDGPFEYGLTKDQAINLDERGRLRLAMAGIGAGMVSVAALVDFCPLYYGQEPQALAEVTKP